MKLLSKDQVYEGDRLTTERQNISSAELMERAGIQIFNWIHDRLQGAQIPIHIFCGIGNNGGDGLVLARHLITHGYNVNIYIVNYSDKRSKDFLINYERIKGVSKVWPLVVNDNSEHPEIVSKDIVVDAIFGIGLNRPPGPWILDLFRHIESSKAFTLSVDIPSGLYTDKALLEADHAINSNYTLSFQTPKLVFFLKETAGYTIQWEVLDIGIDRQYLSEVEVSDELIGRNEVLVKYKPREKYAHKGDYGHALVVGGSYGKIGAVLLASKGCLFSGAGLVTAYIPKCGYNAIQTSIPEIMVETDDHEKRITKIRSNVSSNVIAVGMGMGTDKESSKSLEGLLTSTQTPMVLDADAINILSTHPEWVALVPKGSILTPHRGELKRLLGDWSDDFEMLQLASEYSKRTNLIIVVKGAHTITVDGDKRFINTTGNPGMATAGSGDVLSGIITGLVAQSYEPIDAAIMGVYLHGRAGDIGVEEHGYQSLVAGHLIEYLGKAYISLFDNDSDGSSEEKN